MRGLTIVVASADPARFRTALVMAMAQTALGGRASLFCHGDAVALLGDTADLLEEALEMGVAIIACQTGLHDLGIDAATLDARIDYGGPVGVLQALDDDRLVVV